MKITLTAVGQIYTETAAMKLRDLGFHFTRLAHGPDVYYLSGHTEVQLNSMEELLEFARQWGDVIISGDPPELRLYNDYAE